MIGKILETVAPDIVLALIERGITPHGQDGPYVDPNDRASVREILYGKTGDEKLQVEGAAERAKTALAKKTADKKTAAKPIGG
jgi:hypothetical protein